MAVPPAPDDRSAVTEDSSAHDSRTEAEPRRTAPGARRLIAALLVVAVLASAGTLAWLLSQRTGDADDAQAQREEMMSAARQLMLRVNTYGPDLLAEDGTMPEYRELIDELLSPKFAAGFEQAVGAAEATVAQAGYARSTEVFGTGVSTMDSDSGSVLVSGSFTGSYPVDLEDLEGERESDLPLPYRVRVDLVKVDGDWLVDNFTPVTGEATEPGGTPSPAPGESPAGTPSDPAGSPSASPSPPPSEVATP